MNSDRAAAVIDAVKSSVDRAVNAVDPALFQRVAGSLTTGVTVLTTSDDAVDHGVTASSVTSLSMKPPMMLACVRSAALTAQAITRNGRFVINILGVGQEELAHRFTEDRTAPANSDQFRTLADALAHIECSVGETISGESHTVFLGVVRSASATSGQPLTFFRGGFGRFEFAHNDQVYERARAQIIARCFGVDQVVTIEDLSAALDVEHAAAFYALTRLAGEDLVRRDPEKGYVVVPFDARTSDETFDARLAIEIGVIDLVVGHAEAEDLAELRRRFTRMAELLVDDRFVDFYDYLEANYEFHEWLVRLARNSLLTSMFGRLSIKSVMTRSFGSTLDSSQSFVAVQERLTTACENGDAAGAKAAAREYCELAKQRVRDILASEGGRF